MLVACWSVKGGVGVSTVVAGMAAARFGVDDEPTVVADLCGDQALLHGVGVGSSAGLRGWTRAGPDVPDDALERLEQPLDDERSLLTPGEGAWDERRAVALGDALGEVRRWVVADVGTTAFEPIGGAVVVAADRSILVVRACPLSMRAVADLPHAPDAVIVVRDPRRSLPWPEVGARCGAPVVAELDLDPAVGASVDRGVLASPLPRRFVRALGGAW